MSYTLGDSLSASLALANQDPLRATWRRSATAIAQEVLSAGWFDTTLTAFTARIDAALPGKAKVTRVSAWVYGDDTATCDLLVVSTVPSGFTPSESAYELDRLTPGFPLVRLEGRQRVAGEAERAVQRDTSAKVAQDLATKATWTDKVEKFLGELETGVKLLAIVALILAVVVYAPHPKKEAAE